MTFVSSEELQFCERICRVTSKAGVQLREHNTKLGHCFEWKLRNGSLVSGDVVPRNTWEIFGTVESRQRALLNACRALLPHIFTHV